MFQPTMWPSSGWQNTKDEDIKENKMKLQIYQNQSIDIK
jgi:hypothetical protein